jgi:hypothetical protein
VTNPPFIVEVFDTKNAQPQPYDDLVRQMKEIEAQVNANPLQSDMVIPTGDGTFVKFNPKSDKEPDASNSEENK